MRYLRNKNQQITFGAIIALGFLKLQSSNFEDQPYQVQEMEIGFCELSIESVQQQVANYTLFELPKGVRGISRNCSFLKEGTTGLGKKNKNCAISAVEIDENYEFPDFTKIARVRNFTVYQHK